MNDDDDETHDDAIDRTLGSIDLTIDEDEAFPGGTFNFTVESFADFRTFVVGLNEVAADVYGSHPVPVDEPLEALEEYDDIREAIRERIEEAG